jgi:putative ABC transport system substrate-binding protein
VITGLSEQDVETRARIAAFRAGLAAAGWSDSENLVIDLRYAPDSPERARALVAELLALRPDVLLLQAPAVPAILETNSSVPVVFVLGGDPVGSKWVPSLANPGGNLTGFTSADPSIGSKWVEYLKEAAPGVRRIAVVGHNSVTNYRPHIDAAAARLGVDVTYAQVESVADTAAAIAALASQPHGGLVLPTDALTTQYRTAIAKMAVEHRLPLCSGSDPFAEAGGLIVYAVDTVDVYRRSAAYVDRILRGASPGSLPVQRPTVFKLSVNLRTAGALGLAISPVLIARADNVIE